MFLGERPKGSWGAWWPLGETALPGGGGEQRLRCPEEFHAPGHLPLALFLSQALSLPPWQ